MNMLRPTMQLDIEIKQWGRENERERERDEWREPAFILKLFSSSPGRTVLKLMDSFGRDSILHVK